MPLPFTRDTLKTFMRQNIVRCPSTPGEQANIPYVPHEQGVVWARLENQSADGYLPRCIIESGSGGNVYKMEFLSPEQAQDRNDAFKIYWVPYYENSTGAFTMLGNHAEFMFTARMTGCSLGIGSYVADGVVGAAHVNAKNSGDADPGSSMDKMEQQKKVQRAFLYSHGKNNPAHRVTQRIISYDMYMLDNSGQVDMSLSSTTFGVHSLNQPWKFYSLLYRGQGTRVVHAGLKKQVSG